MTGRGVDVVVAVPRLELDRPFTYLLPEGLDAPVGTLVSVRFHGRTVRGWVVGPAADIPPRVLPVRRVLSRKPAFRPEDLELYRWVGERYLSPLAAVIERAHPPRVASEEAASAERPSTDSRPAASSGPDGSRADGTTSAVPSVLHGYGSGGDFLRACRDGGGTFVVRPLPGEEAATCVEAVAACVAGGRDAVVLVPEADPLPATAEAVMDAFGGAAVRFVGGDRRERYRTWLELLEGRYRVVVATRPGVFAPVARLGLAWVNREAHPGHREDRAPYYRVSEVAMARARLAGAVCMLAGLSPSGASAAMVDRGEATLVRAPRHVERAAAPLVEVARPSEEDRSPRLVSLLRASRSAFLLLSRRGYGVARVCRACGEPARCATCGGPLTLRGGVVACGVCGAEGRCAACGSARFGVERGGTERVQEWAGGIAGRPVARVEEGVAASPPRGLVAATAAAVKDFADVRLDLVAILDADRARRRAGLAAPEQVLATWFEAAAWAGDRSGGGRVLVHTREPGDPAIQAVVRWDPWHFHRTERRRLEEAGFPPGFPVFRVFGTPALSEVILQAEPFRVLGSGSGNEAICLVTVRPSGLPSFRERILELVAKGVVSRVEAEPEL